MRAFFFVTSVLLLTGCGSSEGSTERASLEGGIFADVVTTSCKTSEGLAEADGSALRGSDHLLFQHELRINGLGPATEGVELGETIYFVVAEPSAPSFFEEWADGGPIMTVFGALGAEPVSAARDALISACPSFNPAARFAAPLRERQVVYRYDSEFAVEGVMKLDDEGNELAPAELSRTSMLDQGIVWADGYEPPSP